MESEEGLDGQLAVDAQETAEETTLRQAEARFQDAMILIGLAEERLRDQIRVGDDSDGKDLSDRGKQLGVALRALQTERECVADYKRKRGELVGGDLDLEAARAKIREQLDRISEALRKGELPKRTGPE